MPGLPDQILFFLPLLLPVAALAVAQIVPLVVMAALVAVQHQLFRKPVAVVAPAILRLLRRHKAAMAAPARITQHLLMARAVAAEHRLRAELAPDQMAVTVAQAQPLRLAAQASLMPVVVVVALILPEQQVAQVARAVVVQAEKLLVPLSQEPQTQAVAVAVAGEIPANLMVPQAAPAS